MRNGYAGLAKHLSADTSSQTVGQWKDTSLKLYALLHKVGGVGEYKFDGFGAVWAGVTFCEIPIVFALTVVYIFQ